MPISLDEYKKTGVVNNSAKTLESLRMIDRLQQTALKAKMLTQDPLWDMLLSYIQTAVDSYKEERDQYMFQLMSADVVSQSDLIALKMRIQSVTAIMASLEAVMEIPKQLMDVGEKATSIREAIERKT